MDSLIEPLRGDEAEGFWIAAREGRLAVQECAECATPRFPPRPMCPGCRSTTCAWRTTSGQGRVWSFAVPHPPLLPAYAELAPYVVAVIELDDIPSVRIVGNVHDRVGDDLLAADPATIAIGQRVDVTFVQRGDHALPQWVRRSDDVSQNRG